MNIPRWVNPALGACAIVVAASLPLAAQTSDQAEVEAVYRQFAADFNHHNVDAIMSLYVHNDSLFVFDVTPPREHVGWDNYREDWIDLFKALKPPINFSVHDLHITASGDVAYTNSIQEVHTRVNGRPFRLIVRVTDVLRRIGGKWLIVQEHVSVPVNLPSGKADLLSKP